MKLTTKIAGLASALTVASALSASAAFIDFTDGSTGLDGNVFGGITWEVTGTPVAPNFAADGPGAIGAIAGENDGLGIKDDEITFEDQWITITFSDKVTLLAAHFLDIFGGRNDERAHVALGSTPGASAGNVGPQGNSAGYAVIGDLELTGTEFTFFADEGNDDMTGDVALAAIEIAPVPLPAGMVLMLTALGGLGLARRKS